MSSPTARPWKTWRRWTISRAPWIAALLLMFGAIAALSHISGTTMDYSRYNPEWNGTSRIFQVMDDRGVVMVDRLDSLADSGDCLLLVLAPEGEYSKEEISRLLLFLDEGNAVVLVSDREDQNILLSGLGSAIRIRDTNLSSIDRYYDHPTSLVAFSSGEDPLGRGIPRIVLNSPSYLDGGDPVFETSLLSWIDTDGNSRLNKGEILQKYTVVAAEQQGNGTLYVIADPSIFINGMQAPGSGSENTAFSERILSLKPRLLVDQSHSRTASAPPAIRVVNLVKESTIHKMAIITLVFLAVSSFILYRRGKP